MRPSAGFAPSGDETDTDRSELDAALREQPEAADALLLGRVTFEQFRGYWPVHRRRAPGPATVAAPVACRFQVREQG